MTSKANDTLKKLIETETDPERLTLMGQLKSEIAEDEAYGTKLEKRVDDQAKKIRSVILNQALPSTNKNEESGAAPVAKTFSEAVASIQF